MRTPEVLATTERASDPPPGYAWKKELATPATPSAIISCVASIVRPSENALQMAMSSSNTMIGMTSMPEPSSDIMSTKSAVVLSARTYDISGSVGTGTPDGIGPVT